MSSPEYTTLAIARERGVATVTLDHPPMNLLDLALMTDLERLGRELEADTETRAVVFQSANPDYFIAHADVALIQRLPSEVPPRSEELSFFHEIVERYRTLPCATIAAIEGRARGGGSEFLLSLDMRFGAIGRCVLAQPEVALGILPGGSGACWGAGARWRRSSAVRTSTPRSPSATAGSTAHCQPPSCGRSSRPSRSASRRSRARRLCSPSARSTPPT